MRSNFGSRGNEYYLKPHDGFEPPHYHVEYWRNDLRHHLCWRLVPPLSQTWIAISTVISPPRRRRCVHHSGPSSSSGSHPEDPRMSSYCRHRQHRLNIWLNRLLRRGLTFANCEITSSLADTSVIWPSPKKLSRSTKVMQAQLSSVALWSSHLDVP